MRKSTFQPIKRLPLATVLLYWLLRCILKSKVQVRDGLTEILGECGKPSE
jgi:hypothetical protein